MASGNSDRGVKNTLSKLLQMGTVAEYQNDFEMLINRVKVISESLLKSFYISGLKVALQIELLRARPATLAKAFSLACIIEAHFKDERSTTAIAKPNNLNTGVQVQNLEEMIRHKSNKSAISPTMGKNGIGDVLGLIDSGGAHNFAQPNAVTRSEVVSGLPKEFQEGDMVDALSRVVEQKSSKN
ncbi:hypothetical protein Tco_1255137 [Tanacetum coccineum]